MAKLHGSISMGLMCYHGSAIVEICKDRLNSRGLQSLWTADYSIWGAHAQHCLNFDYSGSATGHTMWFTWQRLLREKAWVCSYTFLQSYWVCSCEATGEYSIMARLRVLRATCHLYATVVIFHLFMSDQKTWSHLLNDLLLSSYSVAQKEGHHYTAFLRKVFSFISGYHRADNAGMQELRACATWASILTIVC